MFISPLNGLYLALYSNQLFELMRVPRLWKQQNNIVKIGLLIKEKSLKIFYSIVLPLVPLVMSTDAKV